jgi:transposase-like protein
MQEEQEDVEMEQAGEDDGEDDMEDRSSAAGESLDGGKDGEEVPDEQAVEAFTVSIILPYIDHCSHYQSRSKISGTVERKRYITFRNLGNGTSKDHWRCEIQR